MVEKVVPVFDAATGKIVGYEKKLVQVAAGSKEAAAQQAMTAGAIKKSAEEAKKAEEATRRWNEEIQKMQHGSTTVSTLPSMISSIPNGMVIRSR